MISSCAFCIEGGHQKRGTAQERVEMELLKGAENVTRDKVEAPKPKRRLLDICNSTQAERVFLWMGWPLNKRRLSMSGEIVSMQLFLKDNLEL